MLKATPGPWNIHPHYNFDEDVRYSTPTATCPESFGYWRGMVAAGEKIIAETQLQTASMGWPHVTDLEEARANTWLIVSSPELYAAAAEAAKLLAGYDFLDEKAAAVLAQLDDALAKSEGRVIA